MEKKLLKISLIISLIGIFILLFFSSIHQPALIKISKITTNQLNKQIKITGQIIKIKNYPEYEFQLLTLKDDSGNITITLDKILNLSESKSIIVIGKVSQYKNKLQINANKIIKIK